MDLLLNKNLRTHSGLYIDVFDPKPETITIEDIAHALSHLCRFGGHIHKFYSVASHSVYCSGMASLENKLCALLHDASEAYLIDVPRPIKVRLTNYEEIENKLMTVIANKFGFQWPMPEEVKSVDGRMHVLEWDNLVVQNTDKIQCHSPEIGKEFFMNAFLEITNRL